MMAQDYSTPLHSALLDLMEKYRSETENTGSQSKASVRRQRKMLLEIGKAAKERRAELLEFGKAGEEQA